jgi:hypothetical protein
MNNKITNIISIVLMVLLSLMLASSAFAKFSGSEEVVNGMTAIGLGGVIFIIGAVELLSVILFLVPRTRKVGFLLLLSYLGGAASIELAAGQFPVALVLIAIAWTAVFLRNRSMFLPAGNSPA